MHDLNSISRYLFYLIWSLVKAWLWMNPFLLCLANLMFCAWSLNSKIQLLCNSTLEVWCKMGPINFFFYFHYGVHSIRFICPGNLPPSFANLSSFINWHISNWLMFISNLPEVGKQCGVLNFKKWLILSIAASIWKKYRYWSPCFMNGFHASWHNCECQWRYDGR